MPHYSESQRAGHTFLFRISSFLPGVTFPDGGLGSPRPAREDVPLAGVTDSWLGKGTCPMILSSAAHTAATLGTLTVFAVSVTRLAPYAHSIFYLSSLIFKSSNGWIFKGKH